MKYVKFLNGDIYYVQETEVSEIKKALVNMFDSTLRLHRLHITEVKTDDDAKNNIDYLAWQDPPNVSNTIQSVFPNSTIFRMKFLSGNELLDILDYLDDDNNSENMNQTVQVDMRSTHEIPSTVWGKVAENISRRWKPRKLILNWDSDPMLGLRSKAYAKGEWQKHLFHHDLCTFIEKFGDIRYLEIFCEPEDLLPISSIAENCLHVESIVIPYMNDAHKLLNLPNLHILIMRTGYQTPSYDLYHTEQVLDNWALELDFFNRLIIFRKV